MTSAFYHVKHTPPQALEQFHIGAMGLAFEESLVKNDLGLGLGLTVAIDISSDNSEGGFVHLQQSRRQPLVDDLLPFYADTDSSLMVADSIDSGVNLKDILENEYSNSADLLNPSINLSMSDDQLADMELCSIVSTKSFSRFQNHLQADASWISFEGWAVDENSVHPTCSDMSIDLGDGSLLELPATPVDQIRESKVLALMGYGNTKSNPTQKLIVSELPRDPLENANAVQYILGKSFTASFPLLFFKRLKVSGVSCNLPLPLAPDLPVEAERTLIPTCTSEDIPSVLRVYRNALENIAENLEKHGSAFSPSKSQLARETPVDASYHENEVTTSVFGNSTNFLGRVSPTPHVYRHLHGAENVPVL